MRVGRHGAAGRVRRGDEVRYFVVAEANGAVAIVGEEQCGVAMVVSRCGVGRRLTWWGWRRGYERERKAASRLPVQ